MGATWQTPEQKAFIKEHLASYAQHSTNGTLKTTFWPKFLNKWFETWPIPESSPEVEEEGDAQDGAKSQDGEKSEQAKKVTISVVYLSAGQPGLTVRAATEARLQSRLGQRRHRGPTKS